MGVYQGSVNSTNTYRVNLYFNYRDNGYHLYINQLTRAEFEEVYNIIKTIAFYEAPCSVTMDQT